MMPPIEKRFDPPLRWHRIRILSHYHAESSRAVQRCQASVRQPIERGRLASLERLAGARVRPGSGCRSLWSYRADREHQLVEFQLGLI